ncbi:phosphatidylinositol 3,4,5-trisphosphate 3-phosphatase TPTE2-like [Ptychodera flava]|uniref:phosphatidylinositol 3,4,5-trisphosphate 3-phosphatase TPTE2-like n=1 Tax=Ptychodera flava TaxID=63121 RepID=UPI00396A464A
MNHVQDGLVHNGVNYTHDPMGELTSEDFDLGDGIAIPDSGSVHYDGVGCDITQMKSFADDIIEEDAMDRQFNFYDPPYIQSRDDADGAFRKQSKLKRARWHIKILTDSMYMRLCGVVLVFIDITLVLMDLAWDPKPDAAQSFFEVTSLIVMSYFIIEVSLRIFAYGKVFFYTWYMLLDLFVTSICAIFTIAYVVVEELQNHKYGKLVAGLRFFRVLFFVRIVVEKYKERKQKKQLVSSGGGKYEEHMYELDLTSITNRLIAMSFPSTGGRRNPISEVAHILNTKYPSHYKVYNLCSEGGYDISYFSFQVERVSIEDQNVPSLEEMLKFCEDVNEWLSSDEENVAVLHCNAGKGRTGMMMSSLLVYYKLYNQYKEYLLNFIGDAKSDLFKYPAVETPSQSRYVEYIEQIHTVYGGQLPPLKQLKLVSILIQAKADIGKGDGRDLRFEIISDKHRIFECKLGGNSNCQTVYDYDKDSVIVQVHNSPFLTGDVKLVCYSSSRNVPTGHGNCVFYVWFNTRFIEDNALHLQRSQIDNLHLESSGKVFKDNFSIKLTFSDLHESCA